ncbi:unnamed protein product [Paramecium sonneborni]|uniref:Ubiquitin-like protease family profile domain-containing protein n=1 Tax=Paramecium sonneborni TaxID=65129 RepID=A0A8S1L248_9CILI|nr:unnamed protein product [Paramecium sonneborni]
MNNFKAYQLFSKKIENKEHEQCLQLLLYTMNGRNSFRHLILSLTDQYLKNREINFATVLITNQNQNIEINTIYHVEPNDDLFKVKITQVNQLINNLFVNYYQSNQMKNFKTLDELISIFESIWFPKKTTIKKVIRKIGEKDYRQILLLPNNNIIYTNSNHNDNIILQNSSHFIFNDVLPNLLPPSNLFLKSQLHFIGYLDPVYLIPRGQGILFNNNDSDFCQFKCENFFYTISNGEFQAFNSGQEYFKKGKMKNGQEIQDGLKFIHEKSIAFTDESSITEKFAKSLYPGEWLNQILVDYIIKQYYFQQLLISKIKNESKKKLFNIVLIDTRDSQDIFSSQITQIDKINEEYSIKLLDKISTEIDNRFILLLNVDRCHFICICIEETNIYILNSMNSQRQDKIVGEKIQEFKQFIQKEMSKQGFKDKFSDTQIKIKNVPQQTNGHDCSIYTLFNAMQLIKHQDIKIDDIDFEVSPIQIAELRFQFFQHLLNNNSILSNKKKWFWNSGRL